MTPEQQRVIAEALEVIKELSGIAMEMSRILDEVKDELEGM